MFSWRTGEGFRVEQLREDATYGIGTRQPASLADFPLAAAAAALALPAARIAPVDSRRLQSLLREAAAEVTASP